MRTNAMLLWLVLGVGCLIPIASVEARGCNAQWNYSLKSLQEARRRIKSPAHRGATSRVECGRDVLSALNAESPDQGCAPCRLEYIHLLSDLIVFMRAAAEQSAARENQRANYKLEIETRLKLGNYLVETREQSLIDKYWSDNFEGMGDAMDRSNLGMDFHKEALRNRKRVLSDKSFDTWGRAVRSCESWDFRQGEKHNLKSLKPALLCADECRLALTKIRERAREGQAMDSKAISDVLDTLLPALEQCPAQQP